MRELNLSPEKAFKNDAFKQLLNKAPKKEWVKQNKLANNALYLPIDKTELLLDMIFQKWKVEILDVKLIVNSVVTTIRLHFLDPVTGQWEFHDGIGAKDLQMDAGAKPTEIDRMKSNAVTLAAPISKSEAIKDATHHLGKLFGRDLNRKDVVEYKPVYEAPNHEADRLAQLINNCTTIDELNQYRDDAIDFGMTELFDKRYKEL